MVTSKIDKSSKLNSKNSNTHKLSELRKKIDNIDDQILNLIVNRANIVEEIGKIKNQFDKKDDNAYLAQVKYAPDRLAQIIRRLQDKNPGPLPNSAIANFYNELISACLALEQEIVVSYLGPKGTHTEAAVRQHFGHAVLLKPMPTVAEAIREVEIGKTNFTVVPVENSLEGSVGNTLDLLATSSLIACGEIEIAIHHHLITHAKTLKSIKKVYAHPQALGQCRNWLRINLAHAELIPMVSNSAAAEVAAKNKTLAAIAGKNAAEIYNLPSYYEMIEDSTNNSTRFLVLGKIAVAASGIDRTSLVFSTRNVPGSLHNIIEPFSAAGVSLCRIQSRPAPKTLSENRTSGWQKNWEYLFFIDIEGHIQDKKVKAVIEKLQKEVPFFKIIGSYPQNSLPIE